MASPKPASKIASVTLRLGSGQRTSVKEVWNTSLGGVFMEMPEPLHFGAELGLEFKLVTHQTLKCNGFVVWSTNDKADRAKGKKGAAVRLTDIDITQMRQLAAAVGRNLD